MVTREATQLRADLARVTEERDEAVQHRNAAQTENVTLRVALSEARAALEAACASNRAGVILQQRYVAERDSARRELQQTHLAWALRELLQHAGVRDNCTLFEMWLAKVPSPVAALIRQHAGMPIGKCDVCGRTAPLVETHMNNGDVFSRCCAPTWPGCGEKEVSGG